MNSLKVLQRELVFNVKRSLFPNIRDNKGVFEVVLLVIKNWHFKTPRNK